ncbi:unnamed protein product [Phytophthora fragariaefolia]|uniref:Unnamed protein product n=1 Tax=Phytophthora fragariaefolia TaxID=1490495 RepID=A0A9W6X5B9_9STRA|nr:unnamed protein product [Phytophthora fragariaefolia]
MEGMSVLDQVLNYANGLKPRTRSYVKLENPETLSDVMNLAVKYEVTRFVEEVRDRQIRKDMTKDPIKSDPHPDKRWKGKPFRGKGRFKPSTTPPKRSDDKTCFYYKKSGHINAHCFAWTKEQTKQGNDKPRQGMRVLAWSIRLPEQLSLIIYLPCDSPLNIRVKLGDNQFVDTALEVLLLHIVVAGLDKAYESAAVVYDVPDEFDYILGINTQRVEQTIEPQELCEQRDEASVGGGATLEDGERASSNKDVVCVESSNVRDKDTIVDKMFMMGVVDGKGVQTKFITRKQLGKFLRIKTKTLDEPDFVLVLSNERIKKVAKFLQRRDQPDNVGSA